ncbi:MAG: histidinol-phosphatase [Desulfobacteraceae bacterium]|nr:histidinol-phosphatase [Desulfobacteraceae bacterium]
MKPIAYVSIHGGHSGRFCFHARDRLEEIINRYIELGFAWVGITEHLPAHEERLRYPDEAEANLDCGDMLAAFEAYIRECNRLKEKYKNEIRIFTAFETETYSGYETIVPEMVARHKPDYIVGSLHHVDDLGFDFSREQYLDTAARLGGVNALYERYFDRQFEMIRAIDPAVVGHFDLIRIFDEDYETRMKQPSIRQRIVRNLELIKARGAVMDYNLRALLKGAREPYITAPILELARKMEIPVIPGDDSHGVSDIGKNMDRAVETLHKLGFDTNWSLPRLYQWKE